MLPESLSGSHDFISHGDQLTLIPLSYCPPFQEIQVIQNYRKKSFLRF